MRESMYKFMRVRLIQFMAYPETITNNLNSFKKKGDRRMRKNKKFLKRKEIEE